MQKLVDKLLAVEQFHEYVWEPAVGNGEIAKRLTERGFNVFASDITNNGYPDTHIIDFFDEKYIPDAYPKIRRDVLITKVPNGNVKAFVERAMKVLADGYKVALLIRREVLVEVKDCPPSKVVEANESLVWAIWDKMKN